MCFFLMKSSFSYYFFLFYLISVYILGKVAFEMHSHIYFTDYTNGCAQPVYIRNWQVLDNWIIKVWTWIFASQDTKSTVAIDFSVPFFFLHATNTWTYSQYLYQNVRDYSSKQTWKKKKKNPALMELILYWRETERK